VTQHSLDPTDYPEVNSVLRELLSRAQRTLGDHFVGMYLDGSLAIGDFDPDKSDIDFVVVTDAEVSSDAFGALTTMHHRIAGGASRWGRELEGSYISKRALRYDQRPAAHPYIDRGSVLVMVQLETGYWPIHRHMLREHGVVLAGPPPPALIDPVAPEDLREAVRGILREWWTPMLTEGPLLQNAFYRCYAVLTMSRMLYTLRHGTIVTKPVAANWVQGAFDRRWTPLIQRALAWSREAPPDLGETLALIQHTSEFSKQIGAGLEHG
jgi:predicted nucleotidyltransferase